MRHWSARKLIALLFAASVAAGMSLSVAQASIMAARMVTMSQMDMPDHSGCPGLSDKPGDKGSKAMACGGVCATPVVALLPLEALVVVVGKPASLATRAPLHHGRAFPPDPHPPRTSDIG
ncbi:hypothetical protein ELI47_38555 [Rhizobium ruizarguesonis]|nr:hypothetical protein ELI47_38555 [Rhizobium ruizarguesonis]